MLSDDELYRGFVLGDDSYLDQLMSRLGDELMYYINGYIHDIGDSEDLMIDTFARIMVKKPVIADGKFKTYLFRTGRNLALRFHSVFSRPDTFSLEDVDVEPPDPELVDELYISKERSEILHRCIKGLKPDMQEAIWLVYFQGASYEEAALIMGVNSKKIDHLLTDGKRSLRAKLEQEGVKGS